MNTNTDLICNSLTMSHLQDIESKLKDVVGDELAVEYYPDSPESYRLNHGNGALLLSYAKSTYTSHDDMNAVMTERELTYTVTIVSRNLHSRHGVVPIVDWVIAILTGFTPTHCTKPLRPVRDGFEQQMRGLWFHSVDMSTQGVQVQDEHYNPVQYF